MWWKDTWFEKLMDWPLGPGWPALNGGILGLVTVIIFHVINLLFGG
jgi:hypothetical protein